MTSISHRLTELLRPTAFGHPARDVRLIENERLRRGATTCDQRERRLAGVARQTATDARACRCRAPSSPTAGCAAPRRSFAPDAPGGATLWRPGVPLR